MNKIFKIGMFSMITCGLSSCHKPQVVDFSSKQIAQTSFLPQTEANINSCDFFIKEGTESNCLKSNFQKNRKIFIRTCIKF